ncbi:Dam family site-specific DNA-(adenine-N6)-methyltransferase [archaeon]|nr:Dam family site-specific DNA-(adenine-N6)-methyltransferase [archaeon]
MTGERVLNFDIPLFIKWAGGKTQLLRDISKYLPDDFRGYYEPFVGGGAVSFFIHQNFNPKKIVLSDINEELINTYKVIKNNVQELIRLLKIHKQNDSKEYFYKIRGLDKPVSYVKGLSDVERAARMIYLNKTCFNGLYRVNSRGLFNVPYGRYKNPGIFDENNLFKVSKLLSNVTLKTSSYDYILNEIKNCDFIYLDPPYYPLNGNSFTSYTKNDFGKKEHIRLARFCKQLNQQGVKFLLSNSHTPEVLELYSDFNINTVMARRAINCNGNDRGEIREVLITNY